VTRYGHPLCQGHHIQWLSRGGEDALENLVLVCPSHHVAIHRDDVPSDYGGLSFVFSTGLVEPLVIKEHLREATARSG